MTSTEARPASPPVEDASRKGRVAKGKTPQLSALAGREPRVDLLPGEVHVDRRERAVARRAWLGVVLAAAVAVLASGAAFVHQMDSATALQSAQSETSSLLAQQQKFAEVRSAERDTALLKAAQTVGAGTEIDWDVTLSNVVSALPDGVEISGMTISSADATQPFEQSTVALDKSRIATLQLTVVSPTIPSVPDWTDRLSGVTGYVDSSISSIALKEDTGDYTATIGVDLGEKAYDGKYTKDADK